MIDIIMPIYNEGEGLRYCIDSLLNQTDTEGYNIILVDDGSNDCSSNICDEYAQKYSCVQSFHKENGGCVAARRFGIKNSSGEYIVFVDADDFVERDYIENIKKAVSHPADYYILNNKRNYIARSGYYIEKDFMPDGYVEKRKAYEWIYNSICGAIWDKILVRRILDDRNISFPDSITHGEDFYINLSYLRGVESVYCQNTSSYVHIMDSPTSVVSHDLSISRLKDISILYKKAKELAPSELSSILLENFARSTIGNYIGAIGLMIVQGVNKQEISKFFSNEALAPWHECGTRNIKERVYDWIFLHNLYEVFGLITRIRKTKMFIRKQDERFYRREINFLKKYNK